MRKLIILALAILALVAILASCSERSQLRKYNRHHQAPFR